MKKIYVSLFVLLVVQTLYAQYRVSGKVVFAADNRPVAAASVFFSNTSMGTVSAADGSFTISNIPSGNYDLIISYVGYETVLKTVSITNSHTENILIALKPKPKVMEEVVVGGYEKQSWERWGRFFTEQFIGSGRWGDNCILENHEKIEFRFYKKPNILKAFSDEELVIMNKNLGYRIRYQLEKFEYDFKKEMLYYEGYPLFEDMESNRAGKKRRWAAARNKAYHGSMMHFMRSLYRNKLAEEGFEIRRLVKTPNYEKKRIQQLYKAQILQNRPDGITMVLPVGPKDSSRYYEKVLQQNDWNDYYTPYTISGDSIAYALDSFTAVLQFENHLYIEYKNALTDEDYRIGFPGARELKNPSSAITLLNNKYVLVYANGSYYRMQDILTNAYWAWSEKICRMLPFDYKPEPD